MSTFVAAAISGIALGFLLGLLGFGIVLYKSTSVTTSPKVPSAPWGPSWSPRSAYLRVSASCRLSYRASVAGALGAVMYYCFFRYNDEIARST
jgi:hypothetical protein